MLFRLPLMAPAPPFILIFFAIIYWLFLALPCHWFIRFHAAAIWCRFRFSLLLLSSSYAAFFFRHFFSHFYAMPAISLRWWYAILLMMLYYYCWCLWCRLFSLPAMPLIFIFWWFTLYFIDADYFRAFHLFIFAIIFILMLLMPSWYHAFFSAAIFIIADIIFISYYLFSLPLYFFRHFMFRFHADAFDIAADCHFIDDHADDVVSFHWCWLITRHYLSPLMMLYAIFAICHYYACHFRCFDYFAAMPLISWFIIAADDAAADFIYFVFASLMADFADYPTLPLMPSIFFRFAAFDSPSPPPSSPPLSHYLYSLPVYFRHFSCLSPAPFSPCLFSLYWCCWCWCSIDISIRGIWWYWLLPAISLRHYFHFRWFRHYYFRSPWLYYFIIDFRDAIIFAVTLYYLFDAFRHFHIICRHAFSSFSFFSWL